MHWPVLPDAKREIVKMVMVNGYIQLKQLMKDIGLVQKNMAKEQKPGLMDIYTKVNSRIVFGAAKALYIFQMVQHM